MATAPEDTLFQEARYSTYHLSLSLLVFLPLIVKGIPFPTGQFMVKSSIRGLLAAFRYYSHVTVAQIALPT